MRKISAKTIYPVDQAPLKDYVIELNGSQIVSLSPLSQHDPNTIEFVEGVIVPGFVNTHCHLELSHMKGKVDTGTGLIPFISSVVKYRASPEEEIQKAIQKGHDEMIDNGIVAVGDISNVEDTFRVKQEGKLRYYTFVEMFDFLQEENAASTFAQYKKVYDALPETNSLKKAMVPHAPYSVSKSLFKLLEINMPAFGKTISIHNQETQGENDLLLKGEGAMVDFFRSFQIPTEHIKGTGETAIHYAMKNMNPLNKTLFVHNTLTTKEDIKAAHAWSSEVFWATCPNANMYIENRLPRYDVFMEAGAKMTIGTDSLTSNWQLSILEEMKTIQRFQSYVPFEDLLKWATLNGAEALGYEEDLGSITVGKAPGLLALEIDVNEKIIEGSKVKVLNSPAG